MGTLQHHQSIVETENDLSQKIIAITMRIQKEFPELSNYLNEMPVTVPTESTPELNEGILNKYYESLFKFLASYKLRMAERAVASK